MEYLSVSIGAYSDPPTPGRATVTTTAASSVTTTTASSGGNATGGRRRGGDRKGRVLEHHRQSQPISDTKTSDGAGTGAFTCALTGLWANTIYLCASLCRQQRGYQLRQSGRFRTQDDNDGVDPAIEDDVPGPGRRLR